MGKRREVAARADRTLARNPRSDAGIQKFQALLDEPDPNAAVPDGKIHGPEKKHRAGLRDRNGSAGTHGMRTKKIILKFFEIVVRDPHVRKEPETGIHPVNRFAGRRAALKIAVSA